jgi:4-hydroxy-tetrahydrodipicolinate synthase
MKTSRLHGYIASALVPFDAKLEINESEYVAHLKEISQAHGLCGVYVNAQVGEVFSLSPKERQWIIKTARATLPPSIAVMSGIIGFNLPEMVKAGLEAKEAGADVLEVFPPFDSTSFFRRLMSVDEVPFQFFSELAREVKMPLSIFKYSSETGLSYSHDCLVRVADEIEEVVAMKTSCLTCADYYKLWNKLKGKLSVFVTGHDTVDMLGMMMIGADGAQAGIMALGRENWTRFIALSLEGKYTEARNLFMEKCAPIADHIYGATLSSFRPHRRGSTTALIKEGLVATGRFTSARLRAPDLEATPAEREELVGLLRRLQLVS